MASGIEFLTNVPQKGNKRHITGYSNNEILPGESVCGMHPSGKTYGEAWKVLEVLSKLPSRFTPYKFYYELKCES